METLTITPAHLEAALLRWEQDYRAGKTLSNEQKDRLPVDQVATQNAAYLWGELAAVATQGA